MLQTAREINCQKDDKENLILGTGRMVELWEKQQIVDFLKKSYFTE